MCAPRGRQLARRQSARDSTAQPSRLSANLVAARMRWCDNLDSHEPQQRHICRRCWPLQLDGCWRCPCSLLRANKLRWSRSHKLVASVVISQPLPSIGPTSHQRWQPTSARKSVAAKRVGRVCVCALVRELRERWRRSRSLSQPHSSSCAGVGCRRLFVRSFARSLARSLVRRRISPVAGNPNALPAC